MGRLWSDLGPIKTANPLFCIAATMNNVKMTHVPYFPPRPSRLSHRKKWHICACLDAWHKPPVNKVPSHLFLSVIIVTVISLIFSLSYHHFVPLICCLGQILYFLPSFCVIRRQWSETPYYILNPIYIISRYIMGLRDKFLSSPSPSTSSAWWSAPQACILSSHGLCLAVRASGRGATVTTEP